MAGAPLRLPNPLGVRVGALPPASMRGLHLPLGSAVPYNCMKYNQAVPVPGLPDQTILDRKTNEDPQRAIPLWVSNRSTGLALPTFTRIRRMPTVEALGPNTPMAAPREDMYFVTDKVIQTQNAVLLDLEARQGGTGAPPSLWDQITAQSEAWRKFRDSLNYVGESMVFLADRYLVNQNYNLTNDLISSRINGPVQDIPGTAGLIAGIAGPGGGGPNVRPVDYEEMISELGQVLMLGSPDDWGKDPTPSDAAQIKTAQSKSKSKVWPGHNLTLIRETMEIEDEDDTFIFVWEGEKIVGYRKDQCVEPDSGVDSESLLESDCNDSKGQCGGSDMECEGGEAKSHNYKDSQHSISRKAWKKFVMACVSVVEDARQIHAATPMQGQHAGLLDTTPPNQTLPPWRLDCHTDEGRLIKISVTELTSGMQPEDNAMLFIEKDARMGCPTRNPWQLVQNCATNNQMGLGLAHYLPMNQPLPANPNQAANHQWRQEHHRTSWNVMRRINNTRLFQPPIPTSRRSFDLMKTWMNTWSDPECPRLNGTAVQRARVDPVNQGCGPVTRCLIPDLCVIGTEPDANVITDPSVQGLPFLTPGSDTKFKVPQVLIEIEGGKDRWGFQKALAKGVVEASYALHFYPHSYLILIWDDEVGIYRVQRNIAEEKIELYEEIIPFHPANRSIVFVGGANPGPSRQGALNALINGVQSPQATDLSAKLQLIAQRVIAILLECHQNKNYAETACNDLRHLRGLNAPNGANLAIPTSREGRRQAAGIPAPAVPLSRGFKPIFDDRAVHPDNPNAFVNNFSQAALNTQQWTPAGPNQNQPQAARPRDFDHVDRVIPPAVPAQGCPKCIHAWANPPAANATSICHHINDYNEVSRRQAAQLAGTAYNPWY